MKKALKKIMYISIPVISIIILFCMFNPDKEKNEIINKLSTGGSGRGADGGIRETFNFNYGWTFSKGSGKLNSGTTLTGEYPITNVTYIPNPNIDSNDLDIPYSLNYNPLNYNGESTWKEVSLPHTFNDEDTFDTYTESGLIGERTMYTGTAWYKKSFNLPLEYQTGKKVIIEFEAARQAAKVWVNGNLLTGTYENGFIAFGYEIPSEYLNFGSTPNDITVMVDNSYPYKISGTSTSKVPWHDSHWHPNYGGLYRNSYLYIVDDLHLTVPLYSFTEGKGTYIYTDNETASQTHVHIDAEVKNSSLETKTFTYRAIINDMSGNSILTINGDAPVTLGAGETAIYSMSGILNNIIRWSVDYPYLYSCEVEILVNGIVVDNNLNTFGIRTFRMTSDYGFYLNEYYERLDGWGQKPTWEWAVIGAAYPDWITDYSIKKLKDAGGNYLRFGHSAGSAMQIEMADKYGILVNQPGVDGEGQSSSATDIIYDANSYRLRIESMRDMILYFRNHPSIIMWEIGNQALGLQNTVNDSFISSISWLGYDKTDYSTSSYASILYDVIEKYDYGNRSSEIDNSGKFLETTATSDRMISIRRGNANVKNYVDVAETTDGTGGMNTDSSGNKPSVEGEYIKQEARRGVWDTSTEGFTSFTNTSSDGTDYTNATSETLALLQIAKRKTILNNTGNVGGANWIFSDTNSHGRIQSEVARVSGEVDATMLPKQAYYVNQVMNSDDPSMHIIGHWNYPVGTVKDIYVAANNIDHLELFVNGVSKGIGTKSDLYLYTFSDVTYETGYIEAKAYDASNNIVLTKRITTHGVPNKLRITEVNPGTLYANGSDILILDVELLDTDDNVCVSYDGEVANKLVNFTYDLEDGSNVTGEWLGGYNSGTDQNTRKNYVYLEAGITRVFVRTTNKAGAISITASMDGVSSFTYNTSSSTQLITNGLTTDINPTTTYTLNPLNNKGLGSGIKLGLEVSRPVYSRLYTENYSYSGFDHDGNTIDDSMGEGTKIYSDAGVQMTSVPFKFFNSELFVLPNSDKGSVTEDLLVFDVTRNSTIFIARDPSLIEPEWLTSNYTLTNDTITGSNGIIYEIWKKDITVTIDGNNNVTNTTIVIGGNTDDGDSGLLGYNQFIFVKETEKVTNKTFFNQNFDLFSNSNIQNGWNGFIPDALTNIERGSILGRTGLRFTDTGSADLAYVEKNFYELDRPFSLEFKANVQDISGDKANNWLRVWLSLGTPNANNTNIGIDSYLFKEEKGGSKVYIKTRLKNGKDVVIAVDSPDITVDNWYLYRYHIDPVIRKFYIEVYDETGTNCLYTTESMDFSRTFYTENDTQIQIRSLNTLTFGTGKHYEYYTDYYIDDVIIKPEMDIGASSIIINGQTISLDETIDSYILLDGSTPSVSTVDLIETNDYFSFTRTNDDENNTITIELENKQGDKFEFTVLFNGTSMLEGWNVYPTVSDPELKVTSETKDNSGVIHFNDTSITAGSYITKSFSPINTALRFSFDIFLNDSESYTQELIKMFLSNDEMMSLDDYNKLGLRTHLTPQNATTNEYLMATKYMNSSETSLMDDTIVTKNEWHNIEYYVNVSLNEYTIYLDGIKIIDNYSFYKDQSELDHIVFGTDLSGTNDYYLRNIIVEEVSGKPLAGLIINQSTLPDFDNQNSNYTYYTENKLVESDNISIIPNAFTSTTVEPVITKNIPDQTFTIEVTDNFGDVHTYIITYDSIINRIVTPEELQDLVNRVNTEFVSTDYTFNTWSIVEEALTEADRILALGDNAIPKEYAIAYYELDTAINNVLFLCTYNGYSTSTVETIMYSNNLLIDEEEQFGFDKVLDLNKLAYHGNDSISFTSVPYKFMNAEYLKIKNEIYNDGLIVLKLLKSIDVLVFKDRDAGPLTESGFEYTGEIATTSDGTVYKIYKKTFNEIGSNVNIEFDKIVSNNLTDKNNIVAFIESYKANNDYFFHEDMDSYDVTDLEDYTSDSLFKRSWESVEPVISEVTGNDYADNTLKNAIDARNALHLKSTSTSSSSTYAWGITYKEMAKLYEKIEFKYSFKLDSSSGANNQYIRTWLRDAPGDYENNTGNTDKVHTAVELYIHNPNMMAVIGSTKANLANISSNIWTDVTITLNLKKNTFDISVTPQGGTTTTSTNKSRLIPNNNTLSFVDYVYFASRFQGSTDAYIRDVIVRPLDSNFYSEITVNATPISNYKDLTKAYLYKVADSDQYNSASASATSGTLFTSNSIISNPIISTVNSDNDRFTTISETFDDDSIGTYIRDYKVYYEVDNETSSNPGEYGTRDLVDLIKEAQSKKESYYTLSTYEVLQVELTDAINRLKDHSSIINDPSSTSDVTGDYIALNDAINNLVSLANVSFNYTGKIAKNKIYDDFNNEDVNITNKSSFTVDFSLTTRITGTYVYDGKTHDRYLDVDETLVEGTRITMINKTVSDHLYYYYVVTDEDVLENKLKYSLDDFRLMGTTDSYYTNSYQLIGDVIHGEYTFIIDFADTSGMTPLEHSISFELDADGVKVSSTDILSYNIYNTSNSVDMNVSMGQESYYNNEDVDINLGITVNNNIVEDVLVTDTTLSDLVVGARISVYNGETYVPLPKGTTVTDGLNVYSLLSNGMIITSSQMSVSSLNKTFTVNAGFNGFESGSYSVRVELIGSYDGFNEGVILATKEAQLVVQDKPTCSIYAYVIDGTDVINKEDSNLLKFNIDSVCVNTNEDKIITLSLYKKVNTLYSDYNYELVDYIVAVNNSIVTPFGETPNIYKVVTHQNSGYIREEFTDSFTSSLKNTVESGTYKLVFDIRSGSIIESDELSFVVR